MQHLLTCCLLCLFVSPALGQSIAALPIDLEPAVSTRFAAARDAARHAILRVGEEHRARNPGQRWSTSFDGRGSLTSPEGAAWRWGLALRSYGRSNTPRAVSMPKAVRTEGPRLVYAWDETLSEWYLNGRAGLEHGFDLARRPSGDGKLEFRLELRGDLLPSVSSDGRDARFIDSTGSARLDYLGLIVVDADGQLLDASLEAAPGELRLIVDDTNARYPLNIDPVAQQAYLKPFNTGAGDLAGFALALSEQTLVIGAIGENSGATGVDGDGDDESAIHSGAAYVFARDPLSEIWSQQAYLKASNTGAVDIFGGAVAISGDTLVVGAIGEASSAVGVDGDQSDDSAPLAGAAYVFVRAPKSGSWSQQAYLKPFNTGADDTFGSSVAISGDTLVVGARDEDGASAGVDGPDNDAASDAGAAYVFVRDPDTQTWTQQAYLKPAFVDGGDLFGSKVALHGDTIAVSAHREASSATGVNGDASLNDAQSSGAAYVFVRDTLTQTWSQQAYLKASNAEPNDQFGSALALHADTLVVGAENEGGAGLGVGADEDDNEAPLSGAAYVFVRDPDTQVWTQQAYVKASNTFNADRFGDAVAVHEDTLVVGASAEDSSAMGVDGDGTDNSFPSSGAAYVFERELLTGFWTQQAYLKASNAEPFDAFGSVVATAGDLVVVGALREDSEASGVDGDQGGAAAEDAGATYVFDLKPAWSEHGSALAGVAGPPRLEGEGEMSAGSDNSITLGSAAPSAPSALFVALDTLPIEFKGGTLMPGPWVKVLLLPTDPDGALELPFSMPPGVPAGSELWLQWAVQDATAVQGVALSNSTRARTP